MNKASVLTYVCIGIGVALLLPSDLLASTGNTFDIKDISSHSDKIQNFIFGTPMKIAGILGGAYGLFQSIISSSIKPVLAFGGIGLGVNLVPKFIDAVFTVSGMLIP